MPAPKLYTTEEILAFKKQLSEEKLALFIEALAQALPSKVMNVIHLSESLMKPNIRVATRLHLILFIAYEWHSEI